MYNLLLDHSGMINFLEFVCALWNLLTISEDNYGTMAFLLKEPTGKSVINCKFDKRFKEKKNFIKIFVFYFENRRRFEKSLRNAA